jgi:hypothetical protein
MKDILRKKSKLSKGERGAVNSEPPLRAVSRRLTIFTAIAFIAIAGFLLADILHARPPEGAHMTPSTRVPQIPTLSPERLLRSLPKAKLPTATAEKLTSKEPQVKTPKSGGAGEPMEAIPTMAELQARKLSWVAQKYCEERERRQWVWRIDVWLDMRNSPMVGCGEYYIQNQERTGIPATLSVGIAEAESSSGKRCFAPHNAWGMIHLRYRGGFSSWEEGIRANFDWLQHYYGCPQSMNDCPGYCEGNGTMATVNAVMREIASIDASKVR